MASPHDTALTHVKVRGKRHGRSAEKFHTGKRRRIELQKRHSTSAHLPAESSRPTSLKSRKRKQSSDSHEETPLEKLPAEVLQQIFDHSANIELPLVSRQLLFKLSKSQHLQHHLTSRILAPVLGHPNTEVTARDLSDATRLLNSRFVTWDFFAFWLRNQPEAGSIASRPSVDSADVEYRQLWSALAPTPDLLPPKKLLFPPFTQDKVEFLAVLAQGIRDVAANDASYGEVAYNGLVAAIQSAQPEMISMLLGMGVNVDTELLRIAVTEAGCNEDIVRMLIEHSGHDNNESASHAGTRCVSGSIDLLDPALWAWAEKATEAKAGKGEWLVVQLRGAQQRKTDRDF
ncbi:Hypothetical predicted protein [Lecanosticta acicola]|uniref:F-box domain-containing protein n=1 Tax=Lecanosticta acicola TaxID=111012 RepID=A0AAI8Z320_9PEZI|nr:Hypothetical predicted protein [Lecanosticta acicola]